jgi:hypothetical protein
MNPLSAVNMSECLEAGQTYMIQAAKKIHTEEGLRLFVSLRKRIYPYNRVLCTLPAEFTWLFTDRQIDRIKSGRLFVNLSYFGLTLSDDPIIQVRKAILPTPTVEEMASAGIPFLE